MFVKEVYLPFGPGKKEMMKWSQPERRNHGDHLVDHKNQKCQQQRKVMKKKNMFLPNCGETRSRRLVYDLDKGLLSTNEIRESDHNKSVVTKNGEQFKAYLTRHRFSSYSSKHII